MMMFNARNLYLLFLITLLYVLCACQYVQYGVEVYCKCLGICVEVRGQHEDRSCLCHLGPEVQIEVVMLGSKYIYLMSHLTGPTFTLTAITIFSKYSQHSLK